MIDGRMTGGGTTVVGRLPGHMVEVDGVAVLAALVEVALAGGDHRRHRRLIKFAACVGMAGLTGGVQGIDGRL